MPGQAGRCAAQHADLLLWRTPFPEQLVSGPAIAGPGSPWLLPGQDGLADPGVRRRLEELRARQRTLLPQDGPATSAPPVFHPNLVLVYAKRVSALSPRPHSDASGSSLIT